MVDCPASHVSLPEAQLAQLAGLFKCVVLFVVVHPYLARLVEMASNNLLGMD
jgi:hypothetical protein